MQVSNTHVKFLLKEEEAVFERWFQAIAMASRQSHIDNLEWVRKQMIDGNTDLTVKVWEYFLQILLELRISIPEMDTGKHGAGKGGCYHVPPKTPEKTGLHYKKLLARRNKRDAYLTKYIPAYMSIEGWFEFRPGIPLHEQIANKTPRLRVVK